MNQYVIVTMEYRGSAYDVEIPANVTMNKIKPLLKKAFYEKGISLDSYFTLSCNGCVIDDKDMLMDKGIWDGSILTIG